MASAEPLTAQTPGDGKETERDIQQIVTQTMGGVTTKQLIERQLKEMFGSRKQDEEGTVH